MTTSETPATSLLAEIFLTPGHPDPYPLYRELHRIGPVHQGFNMSVAVSYELCNALLRDRRLLLWDRWPQGQPGYAQSATLQAASRAMVYQDPPRHTRLRAMVNTAFLPRRIQGLREYVRAFVTSRLDEAAERGSLDLIADVAAPLPLNVVGELLGIPAEDRDACHGWTLAIIAVIGNPASTPEQLSAADAATVQFEAYLHGLAAERRTRPRDDLVSRLVSREGDDWESEDEMASNLSSLVLGAFETTIFSVGNSVHALLRHPDQLDVLRNDPPLIECATEELLRFDAPLQFTTPRTAPDDLDICGVRLRAGESILPMLGAANRDPAHVDDPDRLDLRRPARPLAFGAGIHHCIGAGLARIEIQEAIAGLVGRFSQIEMVDDAVEWVPSVAFRGPRALHLAVAA